MLFDEGKKAMEYLYASPVATISTPVPHTFSISTSYTLTGASAALPRIASIQSMIFSFGTGAFRRMIQRRKDKQGQ